jgi:hypothetical protein
MSSITRDAYKEFEATVVKEGVHNEIECGSFLHHAIDYLLPATALERKFEREDRNFFGSADFVISAKFLDDAGHETQRAYIWELKAPQCFLLEKDDNKNRFRPTMDLIKAENQLLHYYQEAVDSGLFRKRFGIMDRQEIRLGGIIIGRSNRIARVSENRDKPNIEIALNIRKEYFYSARQIRLINWDRLLTYVRPGDEVAVR